MNKKKIYHFSQNLISLFTVKGLELALTLGLIPYLIFKVGVENYGKYAFAMAMVLFFVNFLNYGFDLSAVRELAKNKNNLEKVEQLFNEVFSVKLFLIGIAYCIIFILVLFIPRFEEARNLFLLASLLLIGDLFSLRWFFLGLEKMKFITLISFLSTLIYVGLVIVFIKHKEDFIWIPVAEAIGLFVVSGLSFVGVLKQFKIKVQLLSFREIGVYLKSHFNSYINLLLPSTTGVIMVFLVGLFGLPNTVALMQIGVKFTSAFSTVNTILTTVFYPMVNREQRNIKASRMVLLGIGFCLSLVMFFGSPFLIAHWLKLKSVTDFENTIYIIKYLSPIPFLMGAISGYGVNGLLVYFEDQLYSWITIVATLFMIVLGCVLIPVLTIIGGAIAFVSGRLLYALLSYYFFKLKVSEVH
ncbi:oligosaccharide flippase family protein [Flavobacterium sp. NG2]|uniref:oligosaccharide flippase family protein n=1 Tax=Flavobacterium sp. NG2 TaxID=3097547 RepID=UPI002A80F6E4|nr:oligosaccharide flippase family protein [Flavobacterium sp. NG2]WPR71639.1 oligosaccharide flippase family protein [Flavobacterium sp. NG2]